LVEVLRCYYRDTMAGVVHFALNCWFQNLFEADRIRPDEPAAALATGLQPVLVSARLYGRHFYAGAKPSVSLFVVNDDEDGRDLAPTRLVWTVEHQGRTLARGEQSLPAVPYYHNHESMLVLDLPDKLSRPRVDAQLVLQLFAGGKRVSHNHYDLMLADKSWVAAHEAAGPLVWDAARATASLWSTLAVKPQWTAAIPETANRQFLVICDYGWVKDAVQRRRFLSYVASGGRVLLNGPGEHLKTLFPDMVQSFRGGDREIVTMRVPESPAFDGIEVMDLRWFDRGDQRIPIATHGDFKLAETPAVEILAKYTPTHGYLNSQQQRDNMEGAVLFTLRHGQGRVWVTQLAHETGVRDPIAARVLRNILSGAAPMNRPEGN
jgi:hypothetical protein